MNDEDARNEPWDPALLGVLVGVADLLIPAAHGMPSAADVIDERRLTFVLQARPDLVAPLRAALRDELGPDPSARLAALEATEPDHLAALQLVVVGGYYTDSDVRAAIGYPGQLARPVNPLDYPEYLTEGLIDRVLERGPVWRNPSAATGGEGI